MASFFLLRSSFFRTTREDPVKSPWFSLNHILTNSDSWETSCPILVLPWTIISLSDSWGTSCAIRFFSEPVPHVVRCSRKPKWHNFLLLLLCFFPERRWPQPLQSPRQHLPPHPGTDPANWWSLLCRRHPGPRSRSSPKTGYHRRGQPHAGREWSDAKDCIK